RQQRFNLTADRGLAGAALRYVSVLRVLRKIQRRAEYALHFTPLSGAHASASPAMLRYSHALAIVHSFFTTAGGICSTVEISSIDSPPKKRSSTTFDFRASIAARSFSDSSSATTSRSRRAGTVRASSSGNGLIALPRFS